MISLFGLDPLTYKPSPLHDPDRTFPQTNCYVDLWIELLHAQGIRPECVMAFCCCVDFEGDQWTFFKPPPEELLRLCGIDVHEMQLYRPTADHVLEKMRSGRTMTLEVDSFYLPDTATSSYRRLHVKSSVAVEGISLTIAALRKDSFDIAVIPKTWQLTSLSSLKPDDALNLEVDVIAKYVEKLLPNSR